MSSTTNFPFTTPSNYTYDTALIDVTGGVAKLKDLRPAYLGGYITFYTNFIADTANYDSTFVIPTVTYNVVTRDAVNNRVDMTGNPVGGNVLVASANAFEFGNGGKEGTIILEIEPAYTGNPAGTITLFELSDTSGNNNKIVASQLTSGTIRTTIYNSSGSSVNVDAAGVSFTSGKKYRLEWGFDLDNGTSKLYIWNLTDGGNSTEAGTWSTNITRTNDGIDNFYVGRAAGGACDYYLYSIQCHTVQLHTAVGAAESYPPASIYSTANPTIVTNGSFYSDELESFTATTTVTGSDLVKYIITVGGTDKWNNSGTVETSSGAYTQANTNAEVTTTISSFVTSRSLTSVKSFLHSDDGSTTPQLDLISIVYNSSLVVPTNITTLCDLNGYIYAAGAPIANVAVKARPYVHGFQNENDGAGGGFFQQYEYTTIGTTDINGYFSGNIYVQPTGEKWEFKIGKQRYYTELPDQDTVDFNTLTLTVVVDG